MSVREMVVAVCRNALIEDVEMVTSQVRTRSKGDRAPCSFWLNGVNSCPVDLSFLYHRVQKSKRDLQNLLCFLDPFLMFMG
jgi:hypothetical protein